jgi:hypothetical protein
VSVVSSGVHHSGSLARERGSAGLLDRESVHLGTKEKTGTGAGSFEKRDDSGSGDTGARFESAVGEPLGDSRRGAGFFETEFRMLMKVAS